LLDCVWFDAAVSTRQKRLDLQLTVDSVQSVVRVECEGRVVGAVAVSGRAIVRAKGYGFVAAWLPVG
jgi:hypothetical protein